MGTVVDAPATVAALEEGGLPPCAVHIVQVDIASALSKVGTRWRRNSKAASQLPAHDLGIVQVPAVITDGAAAPVVVNLYAPLAPVPAVHQAQGGTLERRRQGKHGKTL